MNKLPRRFLRVPSPGFVALLLLALVTCMQYAGGWYGMELARLSKENELGRHLSDLARLARTHLRAPALDLADLRADAALLGAGGPAAAPDPDYYRANFTASYAAPFIEFAREARLQKLVVIDREGRVLLNTADTDEVLEPFEFWAIDQDEIAQALAGPGAASPVYAARGDVFKRHYVPISVDPTQPADGELLLVLVAGRDYLAEVDALAAAIGRGTLVFTALMLVIGLMIYTQVRRQRQMERQASEADRLASLGTLAAGLAHELRNPLGIIRAMSEDLERELAQVAPQSGAAIGGPMLAQAGETCRDIIEEVDRMNRLVSQFLSLSRGDEPTRESAADAALQPAIDAALGLLRTRSQKQGVGLELAPPAGEPAELRVAMPPGQLRQVLLNLLLNAIEASPAGGRVLIEWRREGRAALLGVEDQGEGIDARAARRIFDPFYTTRATGVGLGLPISRQLALRAGGSLELAPRRNGSGARFELRLPLASAPTAGVKTAGAAKSVAASNSSSAIHNETGARP